MVKPPVPQVTEVCAVCGGSGQVPDPRNLDYDTDPKGSTVYCGGYTACAACQGTGEISMGEDAMSERRWTVDDIMAAKPCDRYPRWRVEELWAGRESLTLKEILGLGIPIEDRLWVALRRGVLTYEQLQEVLNRMEARVIARAARSMHADFADWARRWLDTPSNKPKPSLPSIYSHYNIPAAFGLALDSIRASRQALSDDVRYAMLFSAAEYAAFTTARGEAYAERVLQFMDILGVL